MAFMKGVNLLCLLCAVGLPCGMASAKGAVEIIVNGVQYGSIEAYKAAVNKPNTDKEAVKTVDNKLISAKTAKEWQRVGYEHGVEQVVSDFKQNWDDPAPKFTIASGELEERIRSLVQGRQGPVLFISGTHKLRVMALGKEEQ